MVFSIALVAFVGVLFILALVRRRFGTFEIKNTDIVLGLLPVVLYLFTAGKITKFEYGDLKIETAFLEAAKAPVTEQVAKVADLPIRPIDSSPKGGVDMIPRIIESGSEALSFTIGYSGYAGYAIDQYLRELKDSNVRYAVFLDRNNNFFGMMNVQDISNTTGFSAYALANALNSGDADAIRRQPRFISVVDGIPNTATKQDALKRMEDRTLDFLPVVDNGRLVGIVERSRLTSSLLIEVASRLDAARR